MIGASVEDVQAAAKTPAAPALHLAYEMSTSQSVSPNWQRERSSILIRVLVTTWWWRGGINVKSRGQLRLALRGTSVLPCSANLDLDTCTILETPGRLLFFLPIVQREPLYHPVIKGLPGQVRTSSPHPSTPPAGRPQYPAPHLSLTSPRKPDSSVRLMEDIHTHQNNVHVCLAS